MSFNEWKEVEIQEVCNIRRGASPRPIQDYIRTEGIPWVKIADATGINSRFIHKTKEFIKKEGKEKSRFIEKGTLILSNSATPGVPKIMNIDACVHDGWLILDEFKGMHKEYMYYMLIENRIKLLSLSNGSVFRNLKTDIVKQFKVNIPPIEEQKAIAKILSHLDDKIEVNNQINKRLEDMAQAIFKHWFVDFEFPNEEGKPYKGSGGEMVESELGMIPKGWEVKELGELSNIIGGGTPSTKIEEYYNGDIPWITPKDLSGYDRKFIKKGSRSITQLGLDKSSAKVLPKGSVLFSSRAPIGYISIAENTVTTNQGFKSIDCSEGNISNNYVYYTLINQVEDIKNNATGSTFKEVSGLFMKKLKLILPNENILNKFEIIIQSIDLELKKNYKEIDILINLRDILLPKLMSGEIKVPIDK